MKYRDLLKDAEALIDSKAPAFKLKNSGLISRWFTPEFPLITPRKSVSLSDILSGHGETEESD